MNLVLSNKEKTEKILKLKKLLALKSIEDKKKSLLFIDEKTSKNYAFLKKCYDEQTYVNEELIKGFKGCILEGGARSAKTYSAIFFIIYICLYKETNCTINIIRTMKR